MVDELAVDPEFVQERELSSGVHFCRHNCETFATLNTLFRKGRVVGISMGDVAFDVLGEPKSGTIILLMHWLAGRNVPKQNKAASLSWLHFSSCVGTTEPDSLTITEKTPPDPWPKNPVLTVAPAAHMHERGWEATTVKVATMQMRVSKWSGSWVCPVNTGLHGRIQNSHYDVSL